MERPSHIFAATAVLAMGAAIVWGRTPPSDNSIQTLSGSGGEAAQAYRAFADRFGADDLTAVEIESADPARLLQTLSQVDALLQAAGPDFVLTASRAFAAEMSLLLDEDLGGPDAWVQVRPRLASSPLNQALGLLAPDGTRARAFALSSAEAPPADLAEALGALDGDGVEVRTAGSAVLNDALEARSRRIAMTGLPMVALTCVLVLWIALRRLGLVLILLIPVAMAVLAVDRVHGGLGGSSNLLSVAARPVTMALLLASAIHLVLAWLDLRFQGRPNGPATREAVREKWPAISLALLTTAVGFGSLVVSDVAPIRQFGALTAAGLGVGLPVVLAVVPSLLGILGEQVVPGDRRRSRLGRVALRLVQSGGRRPWPVIFVSAVLTAVGLLSFRGLPTQTHAIDYFGADTRLRQDHQTMEANGLGLQSLEIIIDDPKLTLLDLERLERFGRRAEQNDLVLNRIDLATLFCEANHRLGGGNRLPNPLLFDELLAEPPAMLDAFRDERGFRTTLLVRTASSEELQTLVHEIEERARTHFGAGRVLVTGSHRLILEAQQSLLGTLRDSLLITALVMQLVVLVVLGINGIGWMALLPNALPVAFTFGAMRLLSIPLDLGTSMVAALALGIAVDDTLHFGFACRRRRLGDAARSTGRGIILSSVTIAAGFATLTLSDFAPTVRFGMLTSLAMLWALLGDLVLFPALVSRLPNRSKADDLIPTTPFVPPSGSGTNQR
ncbi:MAG: MMPL family transporter [Myxococcota bacterium]